MAVYLVCEGDPNSLDNRVLNALIVQRRNLPVQIAPAGGSGGVRAVGAYLRGRGPADVAISVRDRDYATTWAVADAGWATAAAQQFIWRRHEIENFLLHPPVVLALFDGYRAAGDLWAAGLPATEADTLALLRQVAIPLIDDHAGQFLLAEIQRSATAGVRFGPPPLPAGSHANAWIVALQQEAARTRGALLSAASLTDLDPAAIAARYQVLLAAFQSPPFIDSGKFLVEMGGHEMVTALAAQLRRAGAPAGFSPTFLEDQLLKTLVAIYQPATTFQPDDFDDLARILAQY